MADAAVRRYGMSGPSSGPEKVRSPSGEDEALRAIRHHMAGWLELAQALRRELEREELDLPAIEKLLQEREAVHRSLSEAVGHVEGDALRRDPELREVAARIIACDRLSMERTEAWRSETARKIGELRSLREGAAGYRRVAAKALADEPTFFDRCI